MSYKGDFRQYKLDVTGRNPVPAEVNSDIVIELQDMYTTQEEADTIIEQHIVNVPSQKVHVVAGDTDICIFLVVELLLP